MPGSVSNSDRILSEDLLEEESPTPSDVLDEEEAEPNPSDVLEEEGEASPLPSSSFEGKQHNEEAASSSEEAFVLVDADSALLAQVIQDQTAVNERYFLVICILLGFLIGVEIIKGLFIWREK